MPAASLLYAPSFFSTIDLGTARYGTLQFTGKERDAETGLDYFGARYYGSALGRFTSSDWSAAPEPVPYTDLTNPQSLNLYEYVLNNPLRSVDADGHVDDFVKDFGNELEADLKAVDRSISKEAKEIDKAVDHTAKEIEKAAYIRKRCIGRVVRTEGGHEVRSDGQR